MNPKNRKKLVTKIKEFRVEKGLSQQTLADQVSVRRETIIRLERGEYNPSLELAYDIAKVFGMAIEELFFYEETDCPAGNKIQIEQSV